MINALLAESDMTVKIMQEVEGIITEQKQKLEATQHNFAEVADGIHSSREETAIIEQQTQVCDTSRETVVDVISNLSALSEENAASAEETTASMEELSVTINLLADAAAGLKDLSSAMDEEIKFFKL